MVFTDQPDIFSTEREAPRGIERVTWKMSGILLITAGEADFGTLCAPSCIARGGGGVRGSREWLSVACVLDIAGITLSRNIGKVYVKF